MAQNIVINAREDLPQTFRHYVYLLDAPLTCSQKGPTLLAPPIPDLYLDPTYCILHEIVGRVVGGARALNLGTSSSCFGGELEGNARGNRQLQYLAHSSRCGRG